MGVVGCGVSVVFFASLGVGCVRSCVLLHVQYGEGAPAGGGEAEQLRAGECGGDVWEALVLVGDVQEGDEFLPCGAGTGGNVLEGADDLQAVQLRGASLDGEAEPFATTLRGRADAQGQGGGAR